MSEPQERILAHMRAVKEPVRQADLPELLGITRKAAAMGISSLTRNKLIEYAGPSGQSKLWRLR